METLLSFAIAAGATLFFVRRHLESIPPVKPAAPAARRRREAA